MTVALDKLRKGSLIYDSIRWNWYDKIYRFSSDVAYGILYLASDEAKFVTGSELVIDERAYSKNPAGTVNQLDPIGSGDDSLRGRIGECPGNQLRKLNPEVSDYSSDGGCYTRHTQ
jgi:hypothetical protein